MKIKVYTNRITVPYQTYFVKATDYFRRHGVNITFDFTQSNYNNLSYIKRQLPQGERILLQPYMANVVPIDISYDMTMFVFNGAEFTPPNIPTGYCYVPIKQPFIDIGTHTLNPPDLTYVEICHEFMHALVAMANQKGFNVTDVMDSYFNNFFLELENSNFGQQWKLLQPYIKSLQPLGTYTYFSPAEVAKWKLAIALWIKLDKARGFSGIPYRITSGYRTVAHNATVGGVEGSEHTLSTGCDILADTSEKRFKIVSGAIQAGFTRIGVYLNHIHLGIGKMPNFPENVMWVLNKD